MNSRTVQLGFEIPTGRAVHAPLHHTVVTGQTQSAGKTTLLEGMIARLGTRALTFVTKPGEASFADARRIQPYFREQSDWQFVSSILEASRGEKLKYERSSIIKMSKGARTLADVQANIKAALAKPRIWDEKALVCLDAYFDVVVPQLAQVQWAKSIELTPGINVMDLTDLNVETQHLVIQSSLQWVLHNARETIVVVPEAWKFIPQGRGTPVKLSAEAFIRQSAARHNYLWLDSQDITGVEKLILKSIPVWILGVQREFNEIKHTLAAIPAGALKPKPDEIATLGLGQFFLTHGRHTSRIYAQPAWMNDEAAQDVATGARSLDDPSIAALRPPVPGTIRNVIAALNGSGETLQLETHPTITASIDLPKSTPEGGNPGTERSAKAVKPVSGHTTTTAADSRSRREETAAVEPRTFLQPTRVAAGSPANHCDICGDPLSGSSCQFKPNALNDALNDQLTKDEDKMSKEDIDAITGALKSLTTAVAQMPQTIATAFAKGAPVTVPVVTTGAAPFDFESTYNAIKARLLQELPLGGGAVIQVTPPEKLRKDFQREESERILAAAKELKPLAKRILKFVEGIDGYNSQREMAKRLGRSLGGGPMSDMSRAVKDLCELGFVENHIKAGVGKAMRARIASDLASYQATEADIEAVYQSVLYEIATVADE